MILDKVELLSLPWQPGARNHGHRFGGPDATGKRSPAQHRRSNQHSERAMLSHLNPKCLLQGASIAETKAAEVQAPWTIGEPTGDLAIVCYAPWQRLAC